MNNPFESYPTSENRTGGGTLDGLSGFANLNIGGPNNANSGGSFSGGYPSQQQTQQVAIDPFANPMGAMGMQQQQPQGQPQQQQQGQPQITQPLAPTPASANMKSADAALFDPLSGHREMSMLSRAGVGQGMPGIPASGLPPAPPAADDPFAPQNPAPSAATSAALDPFGLPAMPAPVDPFAPPQQQLPQQQQQQFGGDMFGGQDPFSGSAQPAPTQQTPAIADPFAVPQASQQQDPFGGAPAVPAASFDPFEVPQQPAPAHDDFGFGGGQPSQPAPANDNFGFDGGQQSAASAGFDDGFGFPPSQPAPAPPASSGVASGFDDGFGFPPSQQAPDQFQRQASEDSWGVSWDNQGDGRKSSKGRSVAPPSDDEQTDSEEEYGSDSEDEARRNRADSQYEAPGEYVMNDGTWACGACTLHNSPSSMVCQACETPRSDAPAGATSRNDHYGDFGPSVIPEDGPQQDEDNDGECLSRISMRTLLVKDWKPCYWIFLDRNTLGIYRSKNEYLYNQEGKGMKKKVNLGYTHMCTAIKRKEYRGFGYLDHFTLEEQMDYGPSTVAKFASHDRQAVQRLREKIVGIIKGQRNDRRRGNYGYGGGDDDFHGGRSSARATYDRNVGGGDKYSRWGSIH